MRVFFINNVKYTMESFLPFKCIERYNSRERKIILLHFVLTLCTYLFLAHPFIEEIFIECFLYSSNYSTPANKGVDKTEKKI